MRPSFGVTPWAGPLRRWLRLHNYDVAVRYRPVVRWIRRADPKRHWRILDVGSGCSGVAPFLPGFRVVGVDMAVATGAGFPLVKASVLSIPFGDQSWDVVTCVDVLEHLAPEDRDGALREILRVCRHLAVVAFPFGPQASEADRRMAAAYERAGRPAPDWLVEHLRHPHPDLEPTIAALRSAAEAVRIRTIECQLNERLRLQRVHRFLARTSGLAYKAFSLLCSVALPLLPPPRVDAESYRCALAIQLGE